MSRILTITWDDLRRDTRLLSTSLNGKRSWKGIVAITRGGMVPATLLAYDMNLRVVDTISLASYDENHQQKELEVLCKPSIEGEGTDWLVIDDLVDTGVTSAMVRKLLPKAHIAVVYAKPDGRPGVDTYAQEVDQDTWIVFPWEKDI